IRVSAGFYRTGVTVQKNGPSAEFIRVRNGSNAFCRSAARSGNGISAFGRFHHTARTRRGFSRILIFLYFLGFGSRTRTTFGAVISAGLLVSKAKAPAVANKFVNKRIKNTVSAKYGIAIPFSAGRKAKTAATSPRGSMVAKTNEYFLKE